MPPKKPCHGPATHGPSNLPGRCQDRRSYFATPATSCGRMRSKRCESELRDGSVWWRKTQGKTVKNHEKTMRKPWKTMKKPMQKPWKTMKNPGKPRKTMKNQWKTMNNYWNTMKNPGIFVAKSTSWWLSHPMNGMGWKTKVMEDFATIHSRANLGQESKRCGEAMTICECASCGSILAKYRLRELPATFWFNGSTKFVI